ncbi:hypothetical protein [Streptomyces noursei]|uniref:hypothetical protein n=1 Tax=Streptomyces noursei TaxID=1971 RepID=UPI00167418FD|nr:hypothetical protein [Streptomyces noursei]MCZ1013513.1 hypothetical protein [Streptomyces noursei]
MSSEEAQMREAVRALAGALETMINLIRADALPTTPEARTLMRKAMAFLDASTGRIVGSERSEEILSVATAVNGLIDSVREQILDDAVAASPVPDHPNM